MQPSLELDLRQRILTCLNEWHVMSLATTDEAGPHAASLLYACDELALVWVSARDAHHSRAIEKSSRVAATIAPDYDDFASIKGVQIQGMARQVTVTAERQRAFALLQTRYRFLARRESLPPAVREAYEHAAVYRLEPLRIVLIDNAQGFGHREVLEVIT